MIPGEPLEVNTASEDENTSVPADMAETWDIDSKTPDEPDVPNDFLSRTFETGIDAAESTPDADSDTDDAGIDAIDDTGTLLDDAEEDVRDALWMSAESADETEDSTSGKPLNDTVLTLPERQETKAEEIGGENVPETAEDETSNDQEEIREEIREETDALIDSVIASNNDETGGEDAAIQSAIDLELPDPSPKTTPETSSSLLSLQAINLLNSKIATTETRYDGALNKIGHALGVIAERIDGLESRITNQAITNVAIAADPNPVDDGSVAPYIARAERELEGKKETGSVDIFDRIARAAETEYETQRGGGTRIIADAGDGRRVGTKRWQPSKTVKKRMEQLEKARNLTPETGDDAGANAAATIPDDSLAAADPAAISAKQSFVDRAPTVDETAHTAAPQEFVDEEDDFDDDSGLSVVPGARGRRKNRARKSRLDEDFEDVFAEGDAEPSIQNLRRKMRQKPTAEEETAAEEAASKSAKSGILGGILGKKAAKAQAVTEDVHEEILEDDDELELMAAFDEDIEAKPKKKMKAVKVTDELDDAPGKGGLLSGPVLYSAIAAVAALAFFVWQKFIA